tara:strand:- start:324 stop:2144 length:1821 start_codon:yes stop_codon:yes gene_type:complete
MLSVNTPINSNTKRVTQPDGIKTKLKEHQLAMIHEMRNLENTTRKKIASNSPESYSYSFETKFGCLCDKVGSGKSLTILGLISCKKFLSPWRSVLSNHNGLVSIYHQNNVTLPFNILVVPHGIVNQWISYLENDTLLNYKIVRNKKTMEECKEYITNYYEDPNSVECDLYLVSSSFYNKFVPIFDTRTISRLIVDEVDSINIKSACKVNAEFTWFISSSKGILENPMGEYRYEPQVYTGWNGVSYNIQRRFLVNKVPHTGYFRDVLTSLSGSPITDRIYLKSDDEFVKESFSLPEYTNRIIQCKNTNNHTILNGIIDQETMNMINAGDIKSAMENMGCKIQTQDNLIEFVTKKIEIQLEDKIKELHYKSNISYSTEQAKIQALENINKQIHELEKKIECIKTRILENNHCPICADDITNKVIVSCCNNPFCFECISISLTHKQSCPMCRKTIGTNDILAIGDSMYTQKNEDLDENREKIENFKLYYNKLKENGTKKLLVFSKYEASFYKIKEYLISVNSKFSELKGSTGRITNIVNKYKSDSEDSIDVLLLNAQYFGSGLNLENTTDIFLYHNMGGPMTNQVIGRAQRPGRTCSLNVTRFCYENEV